MPGPRKKLLSPLLELYTTKETNNDITNKQTCLTTAVACRAATSGWQQRRWTCGGSSSRGRTLAPGCKPKAAPYRPRCVRGSPLLHSRLQNLHSLVSCCVLRGAGRDGMLGPMLLSLCAMKHKVCRSSLLGPLSAAGCYCCFCSGLEPACMYDRSGYVTSAGCPP